MNAGNKNVLKIGVKMNKRIQELWKQAGGRYDKGNQHTWPQYTIDDPEKFAELIVKECATAITDDQWAEGRESWAKAMRYSAEVIKNHFGVEE